MPRLPTEAKTEKVIKAFALAGFVRQGRKAGGSHERLKKPGHPLILTVRHPTMRIGLLKRCIRDAGTTVEEFMELYEQV